MGIMILVSTLPGSVTPVCNQCGIALCWDIPDSDYRENQDYWDNWECEKCNPNVAGSLAIYQVHKIKERTMTDKILTPHEIRTACIKLASYAVPEYDPTKG